MVDALSFIDAKYRALVDFLDSRGISVKKFFVEPLESRGFPRFQRQQ